MDESTSLALDIARELINAGVPVFAAPPCPAAHGELCSRPGHAGGAHDFDLPAKWQLTAPSLIWLDPENPRGWKPGWGLAAVGGYAADFLDNDPRNGGDLSMEEVMARGAMPAVFGVAATPSGGQHFVISPLRRRKATGFLPGLDYQGGAPDGRGRGFVWIAPTVKRSKTDGTRKSYVWLQAPDMAFLAETNAAGQDESLDGLATLLDEFRAVKVSEVDRRRDGTPREFTPAQMEHFLSGTRLALATAEIGGIEDRANNYACALSHFVPSMISEEQAYDLLMDTLGETAYDTSHPASTWEADKFHAVLAGQAGRAPADWYAVGRAETLEQAQAAVTPDEVSALLAEMVPPSVLADQLPPRYMIKGLLTYSSAAWLIGGPGSKKSFVALDMAAHVAMGTPWQGRRVNRGLVVIIAGEGGGSIGKRVAAWHKTSGQMPDDMIRVLRRPVQAGKPEKWAVLVEACRRLRANLDPGLGMFIIVDTQARSTVGIEENSAKEMGLYIDAVEAIKDVTQGCVLSVHHTGKVGGGTRGSSALDGAQDTRLKMEAIKGTLDATLTIAKQKDIDEDEPIRLRFKKVDIGVDADGDPLDSLVLMDHDAWRGSESGIFAGGPERTDDVQHQVSEPEAWTYAAFPDAQSILARQILMALAVHGQAGATQAEVRGVVIERWWPAGFGRKAGQLNPGAVGRGGWAHAWSRCVTAEVDGEKLTEHPEGSSARYRINSMALELCQHMAGQEN